MSNLENNNVYFTCPALWSERGSINTDYRPKNDAFKIERGNVTNGYTFRDNLQSKSGYDSIANNKSNYIVCNPVPFGTSTFPKLPIDMSIYPYGSFRDAFNTIKLQNLVKSTTSSITSTTTSTNERFSSEQPATTISIGEQDNRDLDFYNNRNRDLKEYNNWTHD